MADTTAEITFTVKHGGEPHSLSFPPQSTLADLAATIETTLSIPTAHQKLLVPKLGLLKPPFKDPSLPLTGLAGKSVMLMGSTEAVVSSMQASESFAAARHASRARAIAHPKFRATPSPIDPYNFATIRPLEWLPHPERSLAMLQRLASDPGIRYVMRTHKFSVALLTEMEPLSNMSATHEGTTTRLLGLNRNRGEVIELRLRTDAHDGYRDYNTVRRTLCHELAHNVHGPHDANFRELCQKIEREVETVGRGRAVGGGEDIGRYSTPEREDMMEVEDDDGGWTGGEFVLGVGGTAAGGDKRQGLDRREVLAQAAEERAKRARDERRQAGADTP